MAELSTDDVQQLQNRHYNAELIAVRQVHEDLRILRVRPDGHAPGFEPGQYTTLGLGNWEPRVAGADDEELTEQELRKLLRRAYSFACPMLDEDGRLLPPSKCDFLEFYVVVVRHREDHPPGLTPRLFALAVGSRLHMGTKVTGHYTLDAVEPHHDVLLIGTGTGEAPHTAMTAELLHRGHTGRIVCATCVRNTRDLGYLDAFRTLESKYDNVRYLPLTTREPENLDPAVPGYVGKRYLQEYLASGDLARDGGISLQPDNTHVFLCGNPAMIGAPIRGVTGPGRYPQPMGMIEALESLGFQADEPKNPGNVHYEKYW